MTMNCPLCGALMVWLNGSINHDPPIKYYQCRNDNIYVTKFQDGTYEIQYPKKKINNYIAIVSLSDINTGRQTWKFPTMKMIDSSAAIASNMMFIGSRDGLLYVFGSETTPPYIG
jgi:outer membrane protein assembly factor BamB